MSSTVIEQTEPDWGEGQFAAKRVKEVDISATLLPITQLELEAQRSLTRSTPQVGLVWFIGGGAGRENRRADKLISDRWLVPAVFTDVVVVVRIVSWWIGDEPDVSLRGGAAGNGTGIVLCRQLGDIDLEHAASGPLRDNTE